jgi:hypothetical protein
MTSKLKRLLDNIENLKSIRYKLKDNKFKGVHHSHAREICRVHMNMNKKRIMRLRMRG